MISYFAKKGRVNRMNEKVKTIKYENCTVRLHIPTLTESEKERRQIVLYESAERFAKAVERTKLDDESGEDSVVVAS